MSTDLVPYTLPDMADIANAQDTSKSNSQWWKHTGKKADYPGLFRFQFRCVPAPRGKPSIKEVYEHFFQLPNGSWIVSFCPLHMKVPGYKCFYCELITKMLNNNPFDVQVTDKMQPRQLFVFNVLLRNDEARGPVLHKSHWTWKKYAEKQRMNGKNAFDPTATGRDVIYQMPERDGERHSYDAMLDPTPLGTPEQIKEWIDMAQDIEVNTRCMTYQEQEEFYNKQVEKTSFPGAGNPQGQAQVVSSAPSNVRPAAATVRRLPAAGSQNDDSSSGLA